MKDEKLLTEFREKFVKNENGFDVVQAFNLDEYDYWLKQAFQRVREEAITWIENNPPNYRDDYVNDAVSDAQSEILGVLGHPDYVDPREINSINTKEE